MSDEKDLDNIEPQAADNQALTRAIEEDKPDTGDHLATVTKLPIKRDVIIKQPGCINVATKDGMFPGSRHIKFVANDVIGLEPEDKAKFVKQLADEAEADGVLIRSAPELCNLYYKHRANLLTVGQFVDANGDIHHLVTNTLEGEELEYFLEKQSFVSNHMREWKDKRDKRRQEEEEKEVKAYKELQRLAEIGKTAEAHNWKGRNRELEQENKRLREELREERT